MRSVLEDMVASLRSAVEDLRRRSPRTITLMAVCALIVAVGPLALTLSRKKEYHASSSIAQSVDLPKYTQVEEVARIQLIMGASTYSRDVQQAVADEVAWLDSGKEMLERVRLTSRWRSGRPEVVITARATALDDARTLAGVTTRAMIERGGLDARFEEVYKTTPRGGGRAFDPPMRLRADKERPVDWVLAAFPARLPPPPDPGWAAVAGPALAAALILAVVALGPLNRQRRRDAAGYGG